MKNYSHLLNPNHATIIFKCKYNTDFGQTLRIVGNIEELGSWEPSKSLVMTTNESTYPIWESTQEITGPVGMEIYYKYVVYDKNKNTYIWENLKDNTNRKHVITSSGIFVVNDEKNSYNSFIQKLMEPSNENDFPIDFDRSDDLNFLDRESGGSLTYNKDFIKSLSYDSNQFNGNDLNETFFFCLKQKISSDDRIIIASAHLPFEIDKSRDDKFVIRVTDESLIYSILYGMKEKEICDVVWVGMLKNFMDFTEEELMKIDDFLRENNIHMINISEIDYKNYWIYMNYIIGPVFIENTVDVNNQFFLDYEDYLNAFKMVNTKFGHTIYKVMHENDLIMINDVNLMLIPSSLLNKNTNSRVGIYFHMAFPSSDVIKILPGHQEFLKSILLCDVIGFHVFQFARNFLTACKRIFGIFYEIKFKGITTLNYLGRYIIIRIMHAGIDIDYIKSIIQKKDYNINLEKFKNLSKNKFCLVSVDNPQEASGILFKLIAYKRFLDRFPEVRNNIVLLQIIKKEFVDNKTEKFLNEINTVLKDIIADYGQEVINLMEVKKFTVPERFALFSLPCALFYLQIREGNCMYVNEYIALQQIKSQDICNFGIIITEYIGVSSAIKGAIRVNPYNVNSVINALEKIYYMNEEERTIKYKKDLEHVLQNTTYSWIKNFFIDLKRTNHSSTKIGIGMGLNFRLMKLNPNFQHLNKNHLIEAYRQSSKRLIFLDYEGTLISLDNIENENIKPMVELAPSPRLIKLLNSLSKDEKNIIYIVTGREKCYLDEWFSSINNLGLAGEHGFFYKKGCPDSSEHREWNELFQIKDWSWIESVLKILEGFTEKTEGSYITKKETIISWMYKDCDIYFGHIQANEINTHLQNIYENCKLDIVNGKGYVEIKPRNVNKGYFVSHILKNEFLESTPPDFILTIGDDTSDEEMFKYLNSVQHHISSMKENTKIFTCTIGRKPSSAQYFLNEVHEVIEYLESLNQINNSLRYDRSGQKFVTGRQLSEKNLVRNKSQMKSESNLSYTNLNKKFNI